MYLIMFFITLMLSLKTSWFYNNFTYLSYQDDLRIYYLIWLTLLSLFLLFKTIKIYQHFSYFRKREIGLIVISFISMLVGGYLPYHLDSQDLTSTLHIIFSMIATISLLIIIQFLINHLLSYDFNIYQKISANYRGQLLILGMLIVMFGSINSIVELFFTFVVLNNLAKIEKSVT